MTTAPRKAVPAVPARLATTTLIVRDGAPGLEVLMVKRSLQASFMPGAYVFPGGAVDVDDGHHNTLRLCDESVAELERRIGGVVNAAGQAAAWVVAGLRECFEECGLWLGVDESPGAASLRQRLHAGEAMAALAASAGLQLHTSALHPWAHWITPVGLAKRFDTLFLVARAPHGQLPSVDQGETTTLAWVHPPEALAAQARGEFQMEFATVSVLKTLKPFALQPAQALLDHAATLSSLPLVLPRLLLDEHGHIRGVVLPGQPGYDTAGLTG